jgi:Ca2+-binding EF-hand superfamily protein
MLTQLQKQKLPALFALRDVDRDGFLTRADYEAHTRRVAEFKGIAPDSEQAGQFREQSLRFWERLVQSADLDDDARVSKDEWLGYWAKILSSPELYDQVVKPIAYSALGMFDRNDDGRVEPDDYASINMWRGLDPAAAKETFQRLDLNGDGYLTVDEAVTLVEEYFRSDDPNAPGNWFFGPW